MARAEVVFYLPWQIMVLCFEAQNQEWQTISKFWGLTMLHTSLLHLSQSTCCLEVKSWGHSSPGSHDFYQEMDTLIKLQQRLRAVYLWSNYWRTFESCLYLHLYSCTSYAKLTSCVWLYFISFNLPHLNYTSPYKRAWSTCSVAFVLRLLASYISRCFRYLQSHSEQASSTTTSSPHKNADFVSSTFDRHLAVQLMSTAPDNIQSAMASKEVPLATSPRASGIEIAITSTATSTIAKDSVTPKKESWIASHMPKSKCALIFVPLVILATCVAIVVLTVIASTKTKEYVSEEEARLLVIHSYPKYVNFSLMAMVDTLH